MYAFHITCINSYGHVYNINTKRNRQNSCYNITLTSATDQGTGRGVDMSETRQVRKPEQQTELTDYGRRTSRMGVANLDQRRITTNAGRT